MYQCMYACACDARLVFTEFLYNKDVNAISSTLSTRLATVAVVAVAVVEELESILVVTVFCFFFY